tara:strand:- start:1026 stop:1748 length:723 start_codon:yes stop_codon:yes gene_type:complete
MKKFDQKAVSLFRNSKSGVLSTISKDNKDYPFGSFVTFASFINRIPIFYLSDIAQHTKNLKYKPHGCLTIVNSSSKEKDKQNNERLSLMGDLVKIKENEKKIIKEKFYALRPESKNYEKFHGFNFYKLKVNKARWIGGFGKIGWLSTDYWKDNNIQWSSKENDIIDHMNSDHSDTVSAALNCVHSIKDNNAKILQLTIDGYYAISNSKLYFIQTPNICLTSEDYRKNLIKLSKEHKDYKF